MIVARFKPDFASWRKTARQYLQSERSPPEIHWVSARDAQEDLFGNVSDDEVGDVLDAKKVFFTEARFSEKVYAVSPEFIERAEYVSVHRDDDRWGLLYRMLWRMTHGEPELLRISIDADTARFDSMFRQVKRDIHKMKAFVRFREVKLFSVGDDGADSTLPPESVFFAWHEPDHLIVRAAAPFFARRFNGMIWSIITPDESAHWDGEKLHFSPGGKKSDVPGDDANEDLWCTYYASIFNPARIKIGAMKNEMAVRYWKNMPETRLIPDLIRQAPLRLQEFYENQPVTADPFIAARADESLSALREASKSCRACNLCNVGTQTVFGEGPEDAEIMIIGEQPGDEEDRKGRPFIGPAGQLLDRALREAGITREKAYLTNAVKHFKWKPQGKIRLHQKPSAGEISTCKPWLMEELKHIQPKILILLGTSAAQATLGKAVRLMDVRGKWMETPHCSRTFVTTHPSAILRTMGEREQAAAYAEFVADLRAAKAGFISSKNDDDSTP